MRRFSQVDVFAADPHRGNPVAVVSDAEGLDDETMQRFAAWTNLSETTFLLRPTSPEADYRVRIFTPARELGFAGHPTLGTCHAWLAWGGDPADPDRIVQECGAGHVEIRRRVGRLAFAAPPLLRSGPVGDEDMEEIVRALGIGPGEVVDAAWVDNGPGWVAVLLADPKRVLSLVPRSTHLDIGVVAPLPPGSPEAFEVRAFFPKDGAMTEDPVTGSLNASLAEWLIGTGRATPPYVARQGTALGRAGRVHVDLDVHGRIWVGGGTVACVEGHVRFGRDEA